VVVIASILRNPVYAGRVRSSGHEYAGEHEAILPEGTFEAAQELIAQRADMAPRSQGTSHLLSGIARCGRCRRNLVTHHTKLKTPGQFHVSYRHPSSRTGDQCLTIHKTASKMEALVLEQVRKLAETPRLRKSALASARQELTARGRPLAAERDDVLSKLAEGESAFDKWVDRLDRGVIDEEQFVRLNEGHLQGKAALRRRLEELEQEAERAVDLELVVAEAEKILQSFGSTWEALTADEQREVLRSLVECLDVYHDHMELKLLFTPAVTLSLDFPRGRQPKAPATGEGER
jgi:site-specific DNA recombinase